MSAVRRRRSLTPILVVLLPILLIAGIWLGGHPSNLPGFARDALVGDSEGRLYDEALDTIADNYYRRVDKDELLDKGLSAGVKSLDDRFSAYFDPKAYKEFEEATDGSVRGGRDERRRGQARPARDDRVQGIAGAARRDPRPAI